MHEKKEKGDIGLVCALATATKQKFHCSLPISEHLPYDFIAEKDGVCKRIQVRYTTPCNGVLSVKLRSTWSDRNGNHGRNRKISDFDILSIYNPENGQVYFIKAEEFNNESAINLRLIETKNKQKIGIRMLYDFENIIF